MGRNQDLARVEIRLPPDVKKTAEIQARKHGYTSLAAMLTVVATKAAASFNAPGKEAKAELPPPETLQTNNPYIQPLDIYEHQRDLYKFYIDVGVFRPKAAPVTGR